jgi:hypothetical protein
MLEHRLERGQPNLCSAGINKARGQGQGQQGQAVVVVVVVGGAAQTQASGRKNHTRPWYKPVDGRSMGSRGLWFGC